MVGPRRRPPTRSERLAGPVVIGASSLAMIAWTWLTWADDHIDFGRELYVAWRLSLSEVLYRDVAHFSGPLSPYVNALIFRIMGPGILWLVVANLAVAAVAIRTLYRLLSSCAGRLAATAACLSFVTMFGFGELVGGGNYNYVCPYAHEMTHGIALTLLALQALARYHRRGRPRTLYVAGLLIGLAFLTKAEIFLAAALAAGAYLALILAERPAAAARNVGRFLLGAAAPVGIACGLLALAMPWRQAILGTLGSWPGSLDAEVRALYYYRKGMGLDDAGGSLLVLVAMALWHAAAMGPLLATALLPSPRVRRVVGGLVVVGTPILLVALPEKEAWYEVARPLPLYVAALVARAAASWRRAGARRRDALVIAFGTLALGLLAKMPLNARFYHYGFVLGMPAGLLVAAALVGLVPAALDARARGGTLFRVGALAILAAVAAAHLTLTAGRLGRKVHMVGQGVDRFRAGSRAAVLGRTIDEIEARTLPRETLLVIPDGVMLNYLTRRRSPTRYVNFMPPELILFGEERIVDALSASPPDHVAVVHNDTYFPYRLAFPEDFGQKLWAFVGENYEDGLLVGAPPMQGHEFGILLKRRRGTAP